MLTPARIGALAAAGIAEVRCARRPRVGVLTTGTELRAARRGARARARSTSRTGRCSRRCWRTAGAEVERLRAVCTTTRRRTARRSRAALEARRRRHLRRRLGRPARPRARRRGGARGRGGVLGRGHPARQAPVVRRPRRRRSCSACRGTRSRRSSARSCSSGRRCSRCRARPTRARVGCTGVLAAAVRRNAAPRRARPGAIDASTATRSSSSRSTGQESHMIVRAAAADALVHVPRGEGELPAGSPVRYLQPRRVGAQFPPVAASTERRRCRRRCRRRHGLPEAARAADARAPPGRARSGRRRARRADRRRRRPASSRTAVAGAA